MKKLSVLLATYSKGGIQLTAQQDNRGASLSVFSPFKKRGIVSISQLMNNIRVINNASIPKVLSIEGMLSQEYVQNPWEEPAPYMHYRKELQKIFQLN